MDSKSWKNLEKVDIKAKVRLIINRIFRCDPFYFEEAVVDIITGSNNEPIELILPFLEKIVKDKAVRFLIDDIADYAEIQAIVKYYAEKGNENAIMLAMECTVKDYRECHGGFERILSNIDCAGENTISYKVKFLKGSWDIFGLTGSLEHEKALIWFNEIKSETNSVAYIISQIMTNFIEMNGDGAACTAHSDLVKNKKKFKELKGSVAEFEGYEGMEAKCFYSFIEDLIFKNHSVAPSEWLVKFEKCKKESFNIMKYEYAADLYKGSGKKICYTFIDIFETILKVVVEAEKFREENNKIRYERRIHTNQKQISTPYNKSYEEESSEESIFEADCQVIYTNSDSDYEDGYADGYENGKKDGYEDGYEDEEIGENKQKSVWGD